MKKFSPFVLGLSIAVAGSALAAAQETPSMPKVLQITREYLKPYKNGMAHDKTESAFVQTMTKAKFPAYYVGLDSLSGKSRALFLTKYDSFAEWEKDNKIVDKNPALAAALDRDSIADGELLESVDSVVFTYDEDLSYKARPNVAARAIHGNYRLPCASRPWRGLAQAWQDGQGCARQGRDECPLGHVRGRVWSGRRRPTLLSARTLPWPNRQRFR